MLTSSLAADNVDTRYEDARRCLLAAKDIAEGLEDQREAASILVAVAGCLAMAGDDTGANATVAVIVDSNRRDEAWYGIASAQASRGSIILAKETARTIKSDNLRNKILAQIVVAEFKAGNLQEARMDFIAFSDHEAAILDSPDRDRADAELLLIVDIIFPYVQAGKPAEMDAAISAFMSKDELARAVESADLRFKDYFLSFSAVARARAGDLIGAAEVANAIQSVSDRTWVLRTVARLQAKSGNGAAARRTFDLAKAITIKNKTDPDADGALGRIAVTQARSNDFSGARATAARVRNRYHRADAQKGIATVRAAIGNIAEAKAAARKLDDTDSQLPDALCEIAQAQFKASDNVGGNRTLHRAKLARPAGWSPTFRRDGYLSKIVRVQAESGNLAKAKAFALATQPVANCGDWQADVPISGLLGDVAVIQAHHEGFIATEQWVATIPDLQTRAICYVELAEDRLGLIDDAQEPDFELQY